jgi:hypothetical protein
MEPKTNKKIPKTSLLLSTANSFSRTNQDFVSDR